MSRKPTAEDEEAARLLRWQRDEHAARAQFEAERTKQRLRDEGWSEGTINARKDSEAPFNGLIEAFKASQDRIEQGLEANLSDRKSKRKRSSRRADFQPWYMRGGLDLGPTPNDSGEGVVPAQGGGAGGRSEEAGGSADESCGGAGNGRAVPEVPVHAPEEPSEA